MWGEQMSFPATFEEFVNQYKIIDKDQVYTNGSDLIPVFRVEQWLEHMEKNVREVVHGKWVLESDEEMPNPMFKLVKCSICNNKTGHTFTYCPNCGTLMDGGRI